MLSLLWWVADAGKFTLNWSKKITELNNLLPLGYFRLKLAETTYNAVLLNNGWTPFQQPPKLCVLRTHRRNITVFEGCRFCSLIFRILASTFRKLLGHFLRYLYFFIFFFRGLAFPPHVLDEHRHWTLNFWKRFQEGNVVKTPLSCTGLERWKMNVSLPLRLFYGSYHPKLVFLLRKMFKLVESNSECDAGLECRSVKRPSRVPLTRPRGS